MHAQQCILHCTYCTMLFITGYCSKYVYSQTHLHDLLVAYYTGNRQSAVYSYKYNVAFAKYGNNKCAVVAVHMKKKQMECLCISYSSVYYFVSRFPTHKLLSHNSYTQVSTTYTQTYTQTVEVSTGSGRMQAGPGSGRTRFNRAGPARCGPG